MLIKRLFLQFQFTLKLAVPTSFKRGEQTLVGANNADEKGKPPDLGILKCIYKKAEKYFVHQRIASPSYICSCFQGYLESVTHIYEQISSLYFSAKAKVILQYQRHVNGAEAVSGIKRTFPSRDCVTRGKLHSTKLLNDVGLLMGELTAEGMELYIIIRWDEYKLTISFQRSALRTLNDQVPGSISCGINLKNEPEFRCSGSHGKGNFQFETS